MLSSIVFSISSIILTYHYQAETSNFIQIRGSFFNNKDDIILGLFIVMWCFTLITLILVVLNSNLVFFHFWLIKKHMTTYEYILLRREKMGKKIDVITTHKNIIFLFFDKIITRKRNFSRGAKIMKKMIKKINQIHLQFIQEFRIYHQLV